jgi:hypothetical protein
MNALSQTSSQPNPMLVGVSRPALLGARLAGWVLIAGAAVLYLLTLDNGLRPGELLGGDLITHQYAQAQGRFSNAPGYPLYTMGGWLWFQGWRLITGPAVHRTTILAGYSAVWALVALALLYRLILQVTGGASGGRWPVALAATAFYGVTHFFWYYAVNTEQYTSAVAWTLAVVWLAFRWQQERKDRFLLGLALLAGTALAHMVTVLVIVPPLVWFVLTQEPRLLRRPGLMASCLGLLILPLFSYLFVYIQGANHPEWRGVGEWRTTWEWFWSFVSTQQGQGELTWSLTPFFAGGFPGLIVRELTWPGLAAGLLGVACLGRRRALMLYATLGLYLLLCWVDRLGNWYQVIMPAYALIVVGLAAGASAVWRYESRWIRRAVMAALLALLLYRGTTSYPEANSRSRPEDVGLAPAWSIVLDNPPRGSAVFASVEEAAALRYLTEIWGIRPDLQPVSADQARLRVADGDGWFLSTTSMLPLVPLEIVPRAYYSAVGKRLFAVRSSPLSTAPDGFAAANGWQHDFGNGLQLVGGRIEHDSEGGSTIVILLWFAQSQPSRDWSVSVRLLEGEREISQMDAFHPVYGAYPTSRWSPGEYVVDRYSFASAAPNDLGLNVILYHREAAGTFVNLDVARIRLLDGQGRR